MNKIPFLLVALFAFGLATLTAQAAENASARAILILASPEKKASDPRLSSYVENLRRVIPGNMASFQAAGEGSASLSVPGRTNLSLDKGHRLEIEAERSDHFIAQSSRWSSIIKLLSSDDDFNDDVRSLICITS